jgi:hypothetical protein
MPTFTQNVSNTVRVFGEGPSTKWGDALPFPNTMTWGVSTWGEGLSLFKMPTKLIENSQAATGVYSRNEPQKLIENSMPVSGDLYLEQLRDGTGNWQYVFSIRHDKCRRERFRHMDSWCGAYSELLMRGRCIYILELARVL